MEAFKFIPDALIEEFGITLEGDDGQALTIRARHALGPKERDEITFLTGRRVRYIPDPQEAPQEATRENGAQAEPPVSSLPEGPADNARAGELDTEAPKDRKESRRASFEEEHSSEASPASPPVSSVKHGVHTGHGVEDFTVGTVAEQVSRIIQRAIGEGASDIHIEPYETTFRVRYRLDGVLHTVGRLDLRHRDAVISRLKIMATLDIAEKRRPQDSRIQVPHAGRSVDLRVSTLPTAHGEKVVLRILDKSAVDLNLEALGLGADEWQVFVEAIERPTGQVLVTGPTGSGKTTTLYAALNKLNTESRNIITIEDPVEYNLTGINQTRVRSDIGFTFAAALRAFLRQDPDVIMVGEIRDQETADVAVRAALTGHLVLSTLHTNDAPSTVIRLVDMGIEPYLVAASVRLVVAQRLVRRVCPSCTEAREGDPAALRALGLPESLPVYEGQGCSECAGTGFQGRMALFEMMPVTEAIGECIVQGASVYDIRREAEASGLRTLSNVGAEAVQNGFTSPSEVLRMVAA